MKPLYAIAVLDLQHLRDFKLSQLDDADAVPKWSLALKISGPYAAAKDTKLYRSSITSKDYRKNLSSISRWKTHKGAQAALKRVESNSRFSESFKRKFGGSPGFYIVDVAQIWNDSVEHEIQIQNIAHEKIIKKLHNKMIK